MDEHLRLRVSAEMKQRLKVEADERGVKLSVVIRERLALPAEGVNRSGRLVANVVA